MKIKLLLITIISVLLFTGCSSNTALTPELEGEIKGMMQELKTASEQDKEELTEEIFELTNNYRIENNLNPLTMDEALSEIALVRAKEIVNTWSHTRPDGTSFAHLIVTANYKCSLAGENLGRYQNNAEQLINQWIESEGHNANLLGDYTKIGIAVYEENGLLHFVQIFAK